MREFLKIDRILSKTHSINSLRSLQAGSRRVGSSQLTFCEVFGDNDIGCAVLNPIAQNRKKDTLFSVSIIVDP